MDTTWDPFGRPVERSSQSQVHLGPERSSACHSVAGRTNVKQMQFDADGQRIARTVDGKTDRFFSSDLSGEVIAGSSEWKLRSTSCVTQTAV